MSDDSLRSLTAEVRAFAAAREWERYHCPRNLAMALSVEANELLELYLWSSDEGPQPLNPDRLPKVEQEAADVLLCLLNFADRAGIDLADALRRKLVEADEKYPVEKARGRALKYDEY